MSKYFHVSYHRFGHLGVAINLITYDDRFALHRWDKWLFLWFTLTNLLFLQADHIFAFQDWTGAWHRDQTDTQGEFFSEHMQFNMMISKGYWSEFVWGFLLIISTRSILLTFNSKPDVAAVMIRNLHYLWSSQDIDKALYVAEFHQEEEQEEC